MKNEEWFRLRKYPHIGLPITSKDKAIICTYIKDHNKITKHAFLPFIHKQISSKRVRKQYDKYGFPLRNKDNNKIRTKIKPKIRDIYYASHLAANIYSYYSSIIMRKYEKILLSENLFDVVTAYRKIPYSDKRNKCNIDFANEVFNYIRKKMNKI